MKLLFTNADAQMFQNVLYFNETEIYTKHFRTERVFYSIEKN